MLELGIAIRVVSSLMGLAIRLQAVPQFVQHLTDQLMGHLMALLTQFLGQLAYTLACPAQWGLWISPRHWLYQPFQVLAQASILAHRLLAPTSFSADSSRAGSSPLL